MSLEAAIADMAKAIAANTEVQAENNKLIATMLGKTQNVASAVAEKSDAKGKGRASSKKSDDVDSSDATETTKETDDTAATKLTHDAVKKAAAAWLGEFAGDESDPETNARKEKIKAALAKLAGKNGAIVADIPASDLHRVTAWIEKQKAADNGFGAGRLTAKPSDDTAETSDDEDI